MAAATDESKDNAAVVFDIRGPRGALTAEEATARCSAILADGNTSFTSAILSTWAFDEAAAKVVASALAKLPGLVDVDMSDIIAGRPEAIGLAVYRALSDVLKSKQLKSINLSDNALGPKGVEACKEMLTGQNDLERLFLCRNGVSAEAMHTLADLLLFRGPEEPTKLTTLHLFNNMCGEEGAKAAARIIKQSPNLQDFRFSSCRGTEDGGMALAEALGATTSLTKLELSDNMFSPEVGAALAAVIAKQAGLIHLDVSDLSLGDEGAVAVCEAAMNCPKLEYVSLAANDITDEARAALQRLVRALPNLHTVRLEDNDEMGNGTARSLARAISARPTPDTLRHIDISTTEIRTSGFVALAKAVEPRAGFESIKVDGVCIDPTVVEGLREGLVQEFDDGAYESDMSDDEGGDTADEAEPVSAAVVVGDEPDEEVGELTAAVANL